MSDLIQSLPSPPTYSGGITHTWMGESWMVDGEASVMMMAMISSNSMYRQGTRTEFLVAKTELSLWRQSRTLLWKTSNPLMFLGYGVYVVRRRGREGLKGGHTTPRCGLAWPAPRPGVGPLWVFSAHPSGSVGLRVK